MLRTVLLLVILIGAIAIVSLLFLSGHTLQRTSSQADFALQYHFSAETYYQDIDIHQSTLTYTRFEDTERKCETWIPQAPCWTPNDLKTSQAMLTTDELQSLKDLIEQTHFMELKDTYGGADANQRYYTYLFSVQLGDVKKTVTYQSFPGAASMPEALTQLQEILFQLVKKW